MHASLCISRNHLRKDTSGLDVEVVEYGVATAVYLCGGKEASFKVDFKEVPPVEGEGMFALCWHGLAYFKTGPCHYVDPYGCELC